MGRAKIKKKSMFIDMTAMSDVTVLLLTFFMLTSTFVKKEPVQAIEIIGKQKNLFSLLSAICIFPIFSIFALFCPFSVIQYTFSTL